MAKYQTAVAGQFVDAAHGLFSGWIGINEGMMQAVNYQGTRPLAGYADELIMFDDECRILPGFVNPHVHCREPGREYKEDWRTLGLAAAHGGVTTIATMPNYGKGHSVNSKERLEVVKNLSEKCMVDRRFWFGVCPENIELLGSVAEDPLVVGYKIFLTDFDPDLTFKREPDAEFWDAIDCVFSKTAPTGKPCAVHVEDALEFSDAARKSGRPTAYSEWRPEKSEYLPARRVLEIARRRSARVHVCHVSSPLTFNAVAEYGASCEATWHHTELCMDDLARDRGLVMNPPLRERLSTNYIRRMQNNGRIPMIGTDHAPHTQEEKDSDSPPAGVPAEDNYGSLLRERIGRKEMSLITAAAISSRNPARLLGLHDRGNFSVGNRADFAVLRMWGEGRPMHVYSKCGWTPYTWLRDYVEATIKEGKVIFREGEPVV